MKYVSKYGYGRKMIKPKWSLDKIKEGFEKFFEIHNRYPTVFDVDDFKFFTFF